MTKYRIPDLFGYICEAFSNVTANMKYKVSDIIGQIGVADTFNIVKTKKQDCVRAPYAFVSIFLVLIFIVHCIFKQCYTFRWDFTYSLITFFISFAQKLPFKSIILQIIKYRLNQNHCQICSLITGV